MDWLRSVFTDAQLYIGVIIGGAAVAALLRTAHRRWRERRDRIFARRKKVDDILILHGVAESLQGLPQAIKAIADELTPHGGMSLVERVTRIDLGITVMANRLDLSLSQLEMASATADATGGWKKVSRAMQRQTGRSTDELLGRGWYDAIDEFEDRGIAIRRYEEAVRDHREFEQVFSWKKPGGELVLVRMAAWWVPQLQGYVVNSRRLDPDAYGREQEQAHRQNQLRRRRGDQEGN